jgi:hypothetical protein
MAGMVRSVSVLLRCRQMEAPASCPQDWLGSQSVLISRHRRSAAYVTLVACGLIRFTNKLKRETP